MERNTDNANATTQQQPRGCQRLKEGTMDNQNLFVQRVPICASSTVVFTVYEQTASPFGNNGHSTVTTFDGHEGWFGRLGTRTLPAWINAIPVGQERFEAVKGWRRLQNDEAYRAIVEVYPDLACDEAARFEHGEVSLSSGSRNGASERCTVDVVDRRDLV